MTEYIEKFKAYELWWEALALTMILVGLIILLFTIVLPNMGVKALPVSWMAALGSIAILSYSVFYELKRETSEQSISTRVIFDEDGVPFTPYVDYTKRESYELEEEVRAGRIRLVNVPIRKLPETEAQLELVTLNIVDHIASALGDWKKIIVVAGHITRSSSRAHDRAGKDTTFYRHQLLEQAPFKFVQVNYEAYQIPKVRKGYAIWPKGTTIRIFPDSLHVSHPHFEIKTKAVSGYSSRRLNENLEIDKANVGSGFWRTTQQLTVSYTLRKSKYGHHERPEYEAFCKSVCDAIVLRLKVS